MNWLNASSGERKSQTMTLALDFWPVGVGLVFLL